MVTASITKQQSPLYAEQQTDHESNNQLFLSTPEYRAKSMAADILKYVSRNSLDGEDSGFDRGELLNSELKEATETKYSDALSDEVSNSEYVSIDFEQLAQSIQFTTATLKNLKQENEDIVKQSEQKIKMLQEDLSTEKQRNTNLTTQLDALRTENARLVRDSLVRMKRYEESVAALNSKLEKATYHHEKSREWISCINQKINEELLIAAREAEKSLRLKKRAY